MNISGDLPQVKHDVITFSTIKYIRSFKFDCFNFDCQTANFKFPSIFPAIWYVSTCMYNYIYKVQPKATPYNDSRLPTGYERHTHKMSIEA